MTLISNVIADNFIVLAADQRRAFNIGSESGDLADDVNKLFVGNNYCMGIQGDVSNTENIYLNKLKAFISDNKTLNPLDLNEKLQNYFNLPFFDTKVTELNLSISGFIDNSLFSFYYDIKNDIIKNCLIDDEYGVRFNNTSEREELFDRSFIHIHNYLSDLQEEESDEIIYFQLRHLPIEKIINALKFMYAKFSDDESVALVGGQMNYCIITPSSLELHIN